MLENPWYNNVTKKNEPLLFKKKKKNIYFNYL